MALILVDLIDIKHRLAFLRQVCYGARDDVEELDISKRVQRHPIAKFRRNRITDLRL